MKFSIILNGTFKFIAFSSQWQRASNACKLMPIASENMLKFCLKRNNNKSPNMSYVISQMSCPLTCSVPTSFFFLLHNQCLVAPPILHYCKRSSAQSVQIVSFWLDMCIFWRLKVQFFPWN